MPISPAVAAELLSRAAARDNREVTRAGALAWSEDLDDHVSLADGSKAISTHYRASRDWIMPSDINTEVRRIRRTRTDAIGAVHPPAELDGHPGKTITWTREYARAIGDGETPDGATKRACDALDIPVPVQIDTPRNLPELGRLVRRVPQGVEA